jgi:hypothetical protein
MCIEKNRFKAMSYLCGISSNTSCAADVEEVLGRDGTDGGSGGGAWNWGGGAVGDASNWGDAGGVYCFARRAASALDKPGLPAPTRTKDVFPFF